MDVAKNYDGYDVEVPEDDDFDLEFIDLEEEEVLRDEIKREKTLKEALLNLMAKQASLTATRSAIWARDKKDKIDNIIKGLQEKAQTYEKDYRVAKDAKKSAIREYKRAIEELAMDYTSVEEEKVHELGVYEDKQHEAMNKKSDLISKKKKMQASKEYKAYLRDKKALLDEIYQAMEDEDHETQKAKQAEFFDLKKRDPALRYNREIKEADRTINEMEDKIIATEKYLDKLVEARNIRLDEIEKTKEETFSLVKQSFWQKLVGSIVNKFYKAGKVKNSTIEQIKVLTAKIKEEGRKIGENLEQKQEKKAEAREAMAQQRAEARRKHKEDLIASIERRIQETEKQLEVARARSGKNMTPALAGGNGKIVQFEGRD